MTIESFETLVELLDEGLRRSLQGSYGRRAAAPAAVPYLTRARDGLRRLVAEQPERVDALARLALAHEALVEYPEAVACLERVGAIRGSLDRRELRRLARMTESRAFWSTMLLDASALRRLAAFLGEHVTGAGEPGFRHTRAWLEANGFDDPEAILDRFRTAGARSDFQLLANVARG